MLKKKEKLTKNNFDLIPNFSFFDDLYCRGTNTQQMMFEACQDNVNLNTHFKRQSFKTNLRVFANLKNVEKSKETVEAIRQKKIREKLEEARLEELERQRLAQEEESCSAGSEEEEYSD